MTINIRIPFIGLPSNNWQAQIAEVFNAELGPEWENRFRVAYNDRTVWVFGLDTRKIYLRVSRGKTLRLTAAKLDKMRKEETK